MFKMDHNPKPLNSDSDICMKENFNINVTEPCKEYIYDNTYFDETLSIKFDLVCDNEHYRYVLDNCLVFLKVQNSFGRMQVGLEHSKLF